MESSKIIAIPVHWTSPKYSLGQRTKQGVIVGIQYYPSDLSTDLCNGSWRYAMVDHDNCEEVVHLSEQKIQPLLPQELQAELQAEIEIYQRKIAFLTQQLKFSQTVWHK